MRKPTTANWSRMERLLMAFIWWAVCYYARSSVRAAASCGPKRAWATRKLAYVWGSLAVIRWDVWALHKSDTARKEAMQ